MLEFATLFTSGNDINSVISFLKTKSVDVPDWGKLIKLYDPMKHEILTDVINIKDRVRSDGVTEKASRIPLGLEQLLARRYNEYTFSIPVKRVYHNVDDNDTRKSIVRAMEAIYKHARIDSVNLKRGLAYYASCEIFTLWYAVKKENTLYGFNSQYKLKCKTFSPMDGVKLYPYIDEMDDMLAMSFEYTKKEGSLKTTYFETYTAERHYLWKRNAGSKGGWEEVKFTVAEDGTKESGEEIILLKIPGSYLWRPLPVYDGLSILRKEMEYTLSRASRVIAYNASPVLKIVGEIVGKNENMGEARRYYQLKNGGDMSYIAWQQSIDAIKYHMEIMKSMYFMQGQMPDVSFEAMKGLGNIGYDARQTLFTDAHLRIGEEVGPIVEFLERECNVIKAFLKKMNVSWEKEIDEIDVEHIITPFIQNDEKYEIEKWMTANGDKPLITHEESIRKAGVADNAETTYEELKREEEVTLENRVNNIFGPGSAE